MNKKSFLALGFIALVLALAFCCYFTVKAVKAQWVHTHYGEGFDRFLHKELNLTDEQNRQIQRIEEEYRKQRSALERQIRVRNAELAAVIQEENTYSPRVQEKIEAVHQTMDNLQRITIEHIYAMYPHLTEAQKKKLQQLVANALVQNPD